MNNMEKWRFLKKIEGKIIEKYNINPERSKRIISIILAATMVFSVGAGFKSCKNSKSANSSTSISLVSVDNDAVFMDSDGNEIEFGENSKDLLAVIDTEKIKDDEEYNAVVIDSNLNKHICKIDGKYINKDVLDVEEITQNILEDPEINTVSAQGGAWIRKEKVEDPDTEDAMLLEHAESVISSKISEISKTVSSYTWKESIYVDYENKDLYDGYMADTYLLNSDFYKAEGKRFIVKTDGIGLAFRSEPSISAPEVGDRLIDNTEIILVPNFASKTVTEDDSARDWFYVAIKGTDGNLKFGWVAATWYKSEYEEVHYLVAKKEKNKKKKADKKSLNDKNIIMIVDTSSENNAKLKLRKSPGVGSEIIAEIENECEIYTTDKDINNCDKSKEVDGYKWIKVRANGQEGYVAMDFLKRKDQNSVGEDSKTNNKNTDLTKDVVTVNIDGEGTYKGFLGIDIAPDYVNDDSNFEKFVTNPIDFEAFYSESAGARVIKTKQKPKFVYFKIGATYYSSNHATALVAGSDGDTDHADFPIEKLKRMADVCNKNGIPFGFYFFSQCTSEKDIDIEVAEIQNRLNYLGSYEYNVLPFALDIENKPEGTPTRLAKNTLSKGTKYQTDLINKELNKLREVTGKKAVLYTNKDVLNGFGEYPSSIKLDQLDSENAKDLWLVDVSSAHSTVLAKKNMDAVENTSMRQVRTDYYIDYTVDLNFVDEDYYQDLTKSLD